MNFFEKMRHVFLVVGLVCIVSVCASDRKRLREDNADEPPRKYQKIDVDQFLIDAVLQKDFHKMREAFESGANPYVQYKNMLLFFKAYKNPDICKAFLDYGFDPDAQLVDYLYQQGRELFVQRNNIFEWQTPLFEAIRFSYFETAVLLMAYGAQYSFMLSDQYWYSDINTISFFMTFKPARSEFLEFFYEMNNWDKEGDIGKGKYFLTKEQKYIRLALAKGLLTSLDDEGVERLTAHIVQPLPERLKQRSMKALCEPLTLYGYTLQQHCSKLAKINVLWWYNLGLSTLQLRKWFDSTNFADKQAIFSALFPRMCSCQLLQNLFKQIHNKCTTDTVVLLHN